MSKNVDFKAGGCLCSHLLEAGTNHMLDTYYHFAGQGTAYNLVCHTCAKEPSTIEAELRETPQGLFEKIDQEFHEGMLGQPQILERSSTLVFKQQVIRLEHPLSAEVVDLVAVNKEQTPVWVALLKSGEIIKIDLAARSFSVLYKLQPDQFTFSEEVKLVLSGDLRFAAVVNDRQSDGIVLDLGQGKITLRLDRGSYQTKHSYFPIIFFGDDECTLVVHGTEWNRLDISDPATGELLTGREHAIVEGQHSREHYLDYFHSALTISPDAEWIAEYGWLWHPVGILRTWNLKQWLHEDKWESETGASVRRLGWCQYGWDYPLCWIDFQTLAVWGFGDDSDWDIPAVVLYDVSTGKRIRWFAGVSKGLLVFDKFLFSASSHAGTEVWDTLTGERLLRDPNLTPKWYHHGAHCFLTLLPDQTFSLSYLHEDND